MNSKNRMLLTEIEYYQEIWNIYRKKNLKSFQNIVIIFKIKSIDFRFFVFICRSSKICSHSLFILCAIIVVFATRIFRNLDLGIKWVLRCKDMELESLRCIFLFMYIYIFQTIVLILLPCLSQCFSRCTLWSSGGWNVDRNPLFYLPGQTVLVPRAMFNGCRLSVIC